jgi:hypothetical protein
MIKSWWFYRNSIVYVLIEIQYCFNSKAKFNISKTLVYLYFINTMGATSVAENDYPSAEPKFTPEFWSGSC